MSSHDSLGCTHLPRWVCQFIQPFSPPSLNTRSFLQERVLALQRKKQAMIRGAMSPKLTVEDVEELFRHDD